MTVRDRLRSAVQPHVVVWASSWRQIRPLLVLFLLSRLLYSFAGITFDVGPLVGYWQVADTELLKTRLWETVTHLHSQAPLFNLYIGAGLKLFGEKANYFFHVGHVAMGFVFLATIDATLRRLRVASGIRWAINLFLLVTPSLVLHENHFFYEMPTAMLVALVIFAFLKHLQEPSRGLGLFFVSVLLLCLLQASFHLLWFVIAFGIIALFGRARVIRVAAVAALPFLVLAGVYGMHHHRFGGFSLSPAHLAPNLRKHTCENLDPALRRQLVREGKLSKLANLKMFSSSGYVKRFVDVEETGIPILDQERRQNRKNNFHNLVYLEESRQVMADVEYVMEHYPELYRNAIWSSFKEWFFLPVEQTRPVPGARNLNAIRPFWMWFAKTIYRQPKPFDVPSRFYLVFIPGTLVVGLLMLGWAAFRRQRELGGFLFFTGFVFVSGTLPQVFIAITDLNRYRFRVEICLLYVAALGATGVWRFGLRRWRRWRERRTENRVEPEGTFEAPHDDRLDVPPPQTSAA